MDKFRIQLPKDLYDEIKPAAAARFMTPAAFVGLAVYELTKGRITTKPEKPKPEPEKPAPKVLTKVSEWKVSEWDDEPEKPAPKVLTPVSEWDDWADE